VAGEHAANQSASHATNLVGLVPDAAHVQYDAVLVGHIQQVAVDLGRARGAGRDRRCWRLAGVVGAGRTMLLVRLLLLLLARILVGRRGRPLLVQIIEVVALVRLCSLGLRLGLLSGPNGRFLAHRLLRRRCVGRSGAGADGGCVGCCRRLRPGFIFVMIKVDRRLGIIIEPAQLPA
jgi:hypothetical protein